MTEILIVEDEILVAADVAHILRDLGYGVSGIAARGEEAVALARDRHPDLVLMDVLLKGPMDGIEAAALIRQEHDVPVVYLTAHSDQPTLERAKATASFGYLLKPLEPVALRTQLEMAFYKHDAERKLRESEERLRLAKSAAGLGIFDYDTHTGQITWDARGYELWGKSSGDPVTLESAFAGIHPEDREAVRNSIEQALDPSGDGKFFRTYRVIHAGNGSERWVDAHGQAFFEHGQPVRLVGTVFDVTTRTQAEEQLKWLASFPTLTPNPIAEIELASGELKFVNEAAERLFPDIAEQGSSHPFLAGALELSRATGSLDSVPVREVAVGDHFYQQSLKVTPAGKRLRLYGVNVTGRKRVEEELQRSKAHLQRVIDNMLSFVGILAVDGTVLECNQPALTVSGLTREQVVGIKFWECSWWTYDERIAAQVKEAVLRAAAGEIVRYDTTGRVAGEGRMDVDLMLAPVRGEQGGVEFIIPSAVEITGRKQYEAALNQQVEERTQDLLVARDGALAADRAKGQFLANMSHEIRTPLNGVLGMTELLLLTNLTSEQHHYLELVRQSADSLLVLINDILDFSKIEAGKLELYPTELDLRDTLGDLLQSLGHQAAEKGLELVYRVAPEIPRLLIGDVSRLRQILVNLVSNSLKFTEAGEVVVDVQLHSRHGDQAMLHFQVRDTGCGIPDEKREAIFDPFTQADSSPQRRAGGTGLGLSISRKLAALMGGHIYLDSTVGVGTTVHVTAQFRIVDGTAGTAEGAPVSLLGLRVLVATDHATTGEFLGEIFKTWRMRPVHAGTGAEVLATLEEHARGPDPFRLILADMVLPDMDGAELAKQVRERLPDDSPEMLIASSFGNAITSGHLDGKGIRQVLLKPVRPSELLDAIIHALGSASGTHVAEPTHHGVAARPMRVLLAEDNAVNRLVATKLLRDRGHSVVAVENGLLVLRALEAEPFDAVLMDVQMPVMDGLTATREIRRKEQAEGRSRIPVIALTADAMEADRERCLRAGMDAHIAKPVRSAELYVALEQARVVVPPISQ